MKVEIKEIDGAYWVFVDGQQLFGSSSEERAKRDKYRCEYGDLKEVLENAEWRIPHKASSRRCWQPLLTRR